MTRVLDDPAVPSGSVGGEEEPHQHPLPGYVRLTLFGFSLSVLLSGGALIALFAEMRENTREQVAAVLAELDARTAARNASDAEREARTRRAVCLVIEDLQDSDATRGLALELDCPARLTEPAPPPPVVPLPAPAPAPAGEQPRTGSALTPRPQPPQSPAGRATTPTPRPAETPPAPPPAAPAPAPSRTCLPALTDVCLP